MSEHQQHLRLGTMVYTPLQDGWKKVTRIPKTAAMCWLVENVVLSGKIAFREVHISALVDQVCMVVEIDAEHRREFAIYKEGDEYFLIQYDLQ